MVTSQQATKVGEPRMSKDGLTHLRQALRFNRREPRMSKHGLTHLWQVLRFNRREILQLDFYLGAVGGGAGIALAIASPSALLRGVATDSVLLGVIIGAVVAGVAIL